ncbi:hypothetical protein AUEXF2481DRAFT_31133 [Aureobasidium subglaciale EXF-2481]|uniref:DUF676 domain-containing protein n=1 Tax=Aureobasidium subglaciale (strain EXF-2481) TaxID=1043005 RepID=A0A074Y778_AURSE|nr:uncharacterized protein AUEXF2481DRAFT_31133 [Aureobasidium subglaciale EXF-2481]KAI5212906.1 DUF676-domain-containing protein [Aureobasidium subglaciale]KAI5232389.1 DUF676-domain-containing protein [Aureobasidium subglaciale]KAI5234716.1 DUF676-domain-containing protein [Aureobasidium subglaciale]KAI5268517.1 DUF676-domain-containing protein [Aureobasidium subglaciale]KEQ93560.1 hypothetical protein AUEXF2481DRAFT_31133 [Aureobasidium subglaciale EXF-2481]
MLLIHQAGSVKVGEVVRFTLTYTPSNDRILPSPSHLHLKIKNTSAIPLRAAYLHGPYNLHVAAYPASFNPNHKVEDPQKEGVPDFEPLLKAGSSWTTKLTVPEDIRETGNTFASGRQNRHSQDVDRNDSKKEPPSVTWIIEIASQILFSNTAAVHFELLVGRDERSLDLGFAAVAGHGHGTPGQIHDQQKDRRRGSHSGQQKGVYSRAVKLVVEDTQALWDKPALPTNDKHKHARSSKESVRKSRDTRTSTEETRDTPPKKKKKIHLVVLTHGLHSNIGADMLYMKESIDATVRQARIDARNRKAAYKKSQQESALSTEQPGQSFEDKPNEDATTAPLSGGQEDLEDDGDDDEEQVIVRGFSGNAIKTEKGIQYLGKRLAKYVLNFTYPDQPFQPIKKSMTRSFTDQFKSQATKVARDGEPAHQGSSIHHDDSQADELPYTFTSISFIGHSLGGLIQTYAVAYIQKHAPHFFEQIQPTNFICMASPMLGLSNENPMYVKFALDFGLVGRTGQDLGLTWRAPNIAKSGWNAMMGGFGAGSKEEHQEDPGAKPLLRILPTGPAHTVLRMFRNRTVYSNVVNDGIVPLRTSCLLFLDWGGLGKVDKARRDNGLIGTLAEFGWAELTGANALPKALKNSAMGSAVGNDDEGSGADTPTPLGRQGNDVPQPPSEATTNDNRDSTTAAKEPGTNQFLRAQDHASEESSASPETQSGGLLSGFFSYFRPTPVRQSSKTTKAVRRGQTIDVKASAESEDDKLDQDVPQRVRRNSRGTTDNPTMRPSKRPVATRGGSMNTNPDAQAPPSTSIFEAASDILHPPIPSTSWLIDPASRDRTIFHDRIYHPEDIPPPPMKRPSRLGRSFSTDSASFSTSQSRDDASSIDMGNMKVEEKIARAYHKDLSWRKVLVRLEPDAHNNMIVRRMFANAYGWPVVKHLCDTHFGDTFTATTRDEDEPAIDRAKDYSQADHEAGEEVKGQNELKPLQRSASDMREDRDELKPLQESASGAVKHKLNPQGSAVWDDIYFEGSDDDDDEDEGYAAKVQRFLNFNQGEGEGATWVGGGGATKKQGSDSTIRPTKKRSSTEVHRGLGPTRSHEPYSPRLSTSSNNGPTLSPSSASGEFTGKVLTQEPPSMAAGESIVGSPKKGVAGLGLQKNIEEAVSQPIASAGSEASVSEQVARKANRPS